MEKGFYKNDNGSLLYAPTFVAAPLYTLDVNLLDTYTLPIDGWIYCLYESEARIKLNIFDEVHDI